jgi:hypothetical protein
MRASVAELTRQTLATDEQRVRCAGLLGRLLARSKQTPQVVDRRARRSS